MIKELYSHPEREGTTVRCGYDVDSVFLED